MGAQDEAARPGQDERPAEMGSGPAGVAPAPEEGPVAAAREGVGGGEGPGPTREELSLLLEDARSKADENWDALLRTRAELDNLHKRMAREVENAHKYGLDRMISELLPVKDSMELGLGASAGEVVDAAKVREGIELTLKMLGSVLDKFGVTEVAPVPGDRFDPERHQAMSVQEGSGLPPGSVVMVVQKGYLLNDRLVRPALVMVAK